MTRAEIPSRDEVLAVLAQLQADAANTGRQPAVLALARSLGLANTTFRRNFPDMVAELSRQSTERQRILPPPSRLAELKQDSERLRRDNRQLRDELKLAAAVIQRITLENQHLREQLEASAHVTRIDQAPGRLHAPDTSAMPGQA